MKIESVQNKKHSVSISSDGKQQPYLWPRNLDKSLICEKRKESDVFLAIKKFDNYYSLDLSSRRLKVIPHDLDDLKLVQYFYLEGNKLSTLPELFFSSLPNLIWLDVRNNELTDIHKDVAHHPNLETLLLQGNQISELPLELALVPNLKGVQLQGNPITYPPQNVTAKGFQHVLKFLKEELEIQSPSCIRPIAEPFYRKANHRADKTGNQSRRKHKSMSCTRERLLMDPPEHFFPMKVPPLTCVGSSKPLLVNNKSRPKSHTAIYEREPTQVENFDSEELQGPEFESLRKNIFPVAMTEYERKMAKREAKLRKLYIRDIWMKRIREMMEYRSRLLQKQLDHETLKEWRHRYQNEQRNQRSNKKFEFSAPYDINTDLVFDGSEKPKAAQVAENLRAVSEEMADIFISLKHMSESNIEENLSPKTKQKALEYELKQLGNLQKKLEVLKSRNAKEDAISKVTQRNLLGRKSVPHFSNSRFLTQNITI